MIELNVFANGVAAISSAFKKAEKMIKSGDVQKGSEIKIVLASGEYRELLSYNLSNPLIIEAREGVFAKNCVLKAENCEAFHKDTENRAVFVLGPNCTNVVLKGFTIENTHIKSEKPQKLGNQAEALCWNNRKGVLTCENMRFLSCQDTIHVKGKSFFKNCYVEGDVDFIWGYCESALFDSCKIHTKKDSRAGVFDAYVLQSRAMNGKPGFIFNECIFTADERTNGSKIFIARSSGTGNAQSEDRWDSVALINCKVSPLYDERFWTDDDGKTLVYPPKGSATVGWREYETRVLTSDEKNPPAETKNRSPHGYVMSEEEYKKYYAFQKDAK